MGFGDDTPETHRSAAVRAPAQSTQRGAGIFPVPPLSSPAWLTRWIPPVMRARLRTAPASTVPEESLKLSDQLWPHVLNADCTLPPGEHIRFRSLWMAEVFPPSHISRLITGLKQLGWDEQRFHRSTVTQALQQARGGRSWFSRSLSTLMRRDSPHLPYSSNAIGAVLPAGVHRVHATLDMPLPSVCVLLVHFEFDAATSAEIEALFPREELPIPPAHLRRRPATAGEQHVRPRVDALREQYRRRCASWLTSRLPGIFAASGELPAAELITLERAEPFDFRRQSCSGYLAALGLRRVHGSSAMAGGAMRIGPLFGFPDHPERFVISGRDWELAEEIDPTDPGYPPHACVHRVRDVFREPMVRWALWVLARRYTQQLGSWRDAVAAVTLDRRRGAQRLAEMQPRFLALLNDAMPFASELADFTADGRRYGSPDLPPFVDNESLGPASHRRETFEALRERTHEQAEELNRLTEQVREVTMITGTVLTALSQEQMSRTNLRLQVFVGVLALVSVILAAVALG